MLVHKIISIRSVMDAVTGSVAGRPRGDPYAPSRGHFYCHRVAASDSYVASPQQIQDCITTEYLSS